MWYVMQVRTGREDEILQMIKKYEVQRYLTECFIPRYERKRKYLGQWQIQKAILFPGYIFVISGQIEALYENLKRIPEFTRLLGTGEKWTPMTKEDIALVELLSGKDRLMRFSEGYIEGETVTVVSGPLCGLEGTIRKIDRHKRLAWMEINMFGRLTEIQAGLEILEKNTVKKQGAGSERFQNRLQI